ncbi:MAG TPA: bifunctional (p)ppGpp synthetase/guanosine-3',5'-bis(diphosphate) 3'-pyrophosphohydrolase [Candidatus Coatesbacteria bacterium]|nr:bifunctional (p)ppGpp synthetase/guanosine-3',5'-bis(diphosphate) 3'-pyrophosphohydrolase [Candidatus Coatesbacteria bacterium]
MNLAACRHVFEDTLALLRPRTDEGLLERLEEAYSLAAQGHRRQRRRSGDPFLIHSVEVAYILAELGGDAETVIAGLLHDILEDTEVAGPEIEEGFGEAVHRIVSGLTQEARAERSGRSGPSATLRRLLLAARHDPRILLVKLADRLHNLRTLQHLPPEKRREKALETLEVYAPLAHRLGVAKLRWEMEDRALMFLHPEIYSDLARIVRAESPEQEAYLGEVIGELRDKLEELEIQATVFGRPKHIYSIYRKMLEKKEPPERMVDLLGLRVVTREVRDCYGVLGLVHSLWRPVAGAFSDYIANPKPNLYQSLHTAVFGPGGRRIEVQIRTEEMNFVAEYGVAAHFLYKKRGFEKRGFDPELDGELVWLRRIVDWEKQTSSARAFASAVKVDLFAEQIFVITPKGSAVDMPVGSTVLDFAFRIHTDLGLACLGALVNDEFQPPSHVLAAGDRVEVLTSKEARPGPAWLRFAVTSHARHTIRRYLKHHPELERVNRSLVRFSLKGDLDAFQRMLARFHQLPEVELTRVSFTPFGPVNIRINARVPDTDETPAEENPSVARLVGAFPGLSVEVRR